MNEEYPVNIIVEPGVAEEVQNELPFAFTPPADGILFNCSIDIDIHSELHRTVDAIITLGGDGTILHATSLFSSTYVPPILSFSLGTLGFLLPFSMTFLNASNLQTSKTTSKPSQISTPPTPRS